MIDRRLDREQRPAFLTHVIGMLTYCLTASCLAASFGLATPAAAIDLAPNEKDRLKQCERTLCRMILLKEKSGKDLNCDLTKTWQKSSIEKGGDKKISWGFGDAQCTTEVKLPRATILAALTLKKATIMLQRQTATCKVERSGKIETVRAVLSPKLKLKNGRADKLWINLKEIDGPADIKGTVWTAAGLADSLGLFHRSMIKGINKFAYRKCQQKFGQDFGLTKSAKQKDAKDD